MVEVERSRERREAARADLERLLHGDYDGRSRETREYRSTHGFDALNATVADAVGQVADQLPWSEDDTWKAIEAVVKEIVDADVERWELLVAKILLNYRRAPADDELLPMVPGVAAGYPKGITFKKAKGTLLAGREWDKHISVRKLYASLLYDPGAGKGVDKKATESTYESNSRAMRLITEKLLEETIARAQSVAAAALRSPDEEVSGNARKKRHFLAWALSGLAILLVAVLLAVALNLPHSGTNARTDVMAVPAPEGLDEIDWAGPTFWLPADEPFAGFPTTSLDCGNPQVREWLVANGQLIRAVQVRVRNLDPAVPLSLDHLSARGENSPATPGFFFGCEGGKGGGDDGEIHYSPLSLNARDGEHAKFSDRKATDFQRDVAPLTTAGLYIEFTGEEDFHGTLVLQTRYGNDPGPDLPIPKADDVTTPLNVVYHGAPAGKRVEISAAPIGKDGLTLSCKAADGAQHPCTLNEARSLIKETWGIQ